MDVVWVLNLDAEHELRLGARYRGPSPAMAARIALHASRLAETGLVCTPRGPGPFAGRAWCPTPWALAKLRELGARPPHAPPFEVLRRANHRRFSAELGQTLEGASFVERLDALPPGTWLLKRAFGFAGQERRVVEGGALTAHDLRWIAASTEGLQVEPRVERVLDVALHGYVRREGGLVLRVPAVQVVDGRGAWSQSVRAPEGALAPEEARALEDEARRAAEALRASGYFGAFGVDAFRWRGPSGLTFRARSEVNARYTMGWAVGMGDFRPEPGEP